MKRAFLSATGSPRRVVSFHKHASSDYSWFCAQRVESDSMVIRSLFLHSICPLDPLERFTGLAKEETSG